MMLLNVINRWWLLGLIHSLLATRRTLTCGVDHLRCIARHLQRTALCWLLLLARGGGLLPV
jgi:hypothetical protein